MLVVAKHMLASPVKVRMGLVYETINLPSGVFPVLSLKLLADPCLQYLLARLFS